MTNEEKKQFIISAHKLYMESRPYDGCVSLEQARDKEDAFWNTYFTKFYDVIPKSFFKYRKPTEDAVRNFENDEAWFSHPSDFDDTIDSIINNDIETELDEFKKNPEEVTKRLAKEFAKAYAYSLGVVFDEQDIDNALPLFNEDGTFDKDKTKLFLKDKLPANSIKECVSKLKMNTSKILNDEILNSVEGFLKSYLDLNKRLKNEIYVFSLAEESDNQAMWGLYAEESKGFCIEYEFPPTLFDAQRILLNLFPIYYGEKPKINFFDVLIKGLYSKNQINGISYDDYKEWFLSTYTKDKTYEFQKEWRITFDKNIESNLQSFPFAKSVIIGERASDDFKNRIINAANKKNIPVYLRKVNKTGSKIIIEKIK